jgi:serine/threonine protein kinase
MICFACPACGQTLKVRDEFAGKQGKCPRCKATAVVPPAGGPSRTEGSSRGAGAEAATLPPVGPSLSGLSAATFSPDEDAPDERSLTDFLAPPQGPGEVGRLGSYRVLKVLGVGGMGVVYLAEDPALQRRVALKAMLPALAAGAAARQRFLREARAAAAVEHDHVVHIYQVGEDRGVPFLAMQFLEGESVAARLERAGRLPVREVLRIGREAAEGLAAAHVRGLIHRDVKPANLWLEGDRGRVKILDFGLARPAGGGDRLTQQGAIIGTPAYMAPEQATGGAVDGRTDLFSLGVVLYRLCTGELPFKGADTVSTLVAVATQEPRPPKALRPDMPTALSRLVLQLLAKDPAERPASAAELGRELAKIDPDPTAARDRLAELDEDSEPVAPRRPSSATSGPRRRSRGKRPVPQVVALVVVLGGLAAAGILLTLVLPRGRSNGTSAPGGVARVTDDGAGRSNPGAGGSPRPVANPPEAPPAVGPPPAPAPVGRPEAEEAAANRKAAEVVTKLGGIVAVNTGPGRQLLQILPGGELPAEPFWLAHIDLSGQLVTDANLRPLEGTPLRGLVEVNLTGCKALDGATIGALLRGAPNAKRLLLGRTAMDDAALDRLRGLTGPEAVDLSGTKVTLAGLGRFRAAYPGCQPLNPGPEAPDPRPGRRVPYPLPDSAPAGTEAAANRKAAELLVAHLGATLHVEYALSKRGTRVAPGGQVPSDPVWLRTVDLSLTPVGDGDLSELGRMNLRALWSVNLAGCNKVGTGGLLTLLQGSPYLSELWLQGTQLDDAGLDRLREHKALVRLDVSWTKVTSEGVSRIRQALPKCRVVHRTRSAVPPRPVPPPAAPPQKRSPPTRGSRPTLAEDATNRKALETVTTLGGAAVVYFEYETGWGDPYFSGTMTRSPFWLGYVDFSFAPLTDDDFAALGGVDLRGLREINLRGCVGCTGAGLLHLSGAPNLKRLTLARTGLTDAALDRLRAFQVLEQIDVRGTSVSLEAVQRFKVALPACKVVTE